MFFEVIAGLNLLLHFLGVMLAIIYWRRCPTACALLFIASVLSMLASVNVYTLPFVWEGGHGGQIAALAAIFVRWIAHGLMLVAIFAGRKEPPLKESRTPRPLPDDDDWPPSISKPSTDIQGR